MKVKCVSCKEYVDRDSAIRRGVSSFCSMDCVWAWSRDARRSKGAARITTSRRRKTRPKVTEETYSYVTAKDGHVCRFCGQVGFSLQLHHVVYRSEGGSHEPSNLILLCDDHHREVHSDKRRYRPLLLGLIWLREVEGKSWITLPQFERGLYG